MIKQERHFYFQTWVCLRMTLQFTLGSFRHPFLNLGFISDLLVQSSEAWMTFQDFWHLWLAVSQIAVEERKATDVRKAEL